MTEVALLEFAQDLTAEVKEAVDADEHTIYPEIEFTRVVLERLGEEGVLENPIVLWQEGRFGRLHYKINGYALVEDVPDRLLLVATIYTGDAIPRPARQPEILTACRRALRFFQCSRDGLHDQLEPSNTDASDLARRIHSVGSNLSTLRLLVISDALTGMKSIDMKGALSDTRIIVDLYGIERLHRALGDGLTRDDIVLDFLEEMGKPLDCLPAASATSDYTAYLATIPGVILADLYEKYGTRLLELNVRAFLGVRGRGSVNAGLRETIRTAPHRFLAYNNGLVATVDDMELAGEHDDRPAIRSVRGIQIVNGGQTTASLHRARRQDKAQLDDILVPVKIIRVGGDNLDQMVSAISRSANRQNTVQPADFSANDPFHVAVETLANNNWPPDGSGRWFYERARGSYAAAETKAGSTAARLKRKTFSPEVPKARRFSKTDLAKYLNAWNGRPDFVSYGNQKNFQFFMQSLKDSYPDGFEPDAAWYREFIAKAIIFKSTQKLVRARKFPAYQANIIAYTVAVVASRCSAGIDLENIWREQCVPEDLGERLARLIDVVDTELRSSAEDRMVSEWAKRPDCWTAVNALIE